MKYVSSSPLFAVLALAALVLVIGGCEMFGMNDDVTTLNRKKTSVSDSITVVNQTSEIIQLYPLEYNSAQKAYWYWPDDPLSLDPKSSAKFAIDDIREFEPRQDTLYIAIRARRSYGEETKEGAQVGFLPVGTVIRSPEALKESSFRVEVRDSDTKQ